MTTLAAVIAIIILAALSVFQIALICGAPLGRFAWGGQHRVLPPKLRIGSFSSIIIYVIFILFASTKAGIASIITNQTALNVGLWVITLYLFFGVFLNAISKSKPERNLMTPVAAVLAICFLAIALA